MDDMYFVDMLSETYSLTPSPVPGKDTTYMCMTFALPTDQDYHVIAVEPFIDNINVMHHVLVYGLYATTGTGKYSLCHFA